jgi:hypothetical protein
MAKLRQVGLEPSEITVDDIRTYAFATVVDARSYSRRSPTTSCERDAELRITLKQDRDTRSSCSGRR